MWILSITLLAQYHSFSFVLVVQWSKNWFTVSSVCVVPFDCSDAIDPSATSNVGSTAWPKYRPPPTTLWSRFLLCYGRIFNEISSLAHCFFAP